MSEAAVDPDIIKRTQDTLGKIISAPVLTEKLLNRPPVQFLQDIVKAIIKKTGFLQGLYSEEELSTSYLKEGRDNKTLFMKKLVTAVYIAVKRSPDVRVSKILAGQEADKTNLLLQALAEAINANANSQEVVRKTLQSLGEGAENDDGNRNAERTRERKEQEKPENPTSSTSADRLRSSRGDRKGTSNDREESGGDRRTTSKEVSRQEPADGDSSGQHRRRRSSKPTEDPGTSSHDDRRTSSSVQKHDDDDDQDRKDNDDEASRRRSFRPSSAKGPRKQQNNAEQQRSSSPKAEQPVRAAPTGSTSVSIDRDNDEKPLARPGTASAAKSRKPMKPTSNDDISNSSARVGSSVPRGQNSLIIESKDTRNNGMPDDDDDDDNFLIQEEKPSMSKSMRLDDDEDGTRGLDDADSNQHGALVKKMYDAQKQLEHGSEIAGQRSDVKAVAQNDAQRRREREKIQKDVDKLRETIQTLTKSVVPLGKILEYLQEDYEMMAREMQQYTDEYKRTVVELRKEKSATDQTLEPLRGALVEFDEQIADMKNRIIFMKKKISSNEKANATRLLEIIRKK